MRRIKIGETSLEVAPLSLGTNVFGWTLDEKGSFKILDAFTDAGFNFIDTADMYSIWVDGGTGGQSETINGDWMKERGNREEEVITSKIGGATGVHDIDDKREHKKEGDEN